MGVVSYGRGSLYFSVCLFVYLYACVSVFSLFFNLFASMDSYSHTGDWRYFVLMPGTAAASAAASVAAVATASPTTSMSTVKWLFF